MEIRKLEQADIPQCVEIFRANKPIEGWNDYPESRLVFELNAAFIENTFCRPEYIVATIKNEIVGFAGFGQLGFDDGAYGLFWIQVHPKYQGIGVGFKLTKYRLAKIVSVKGELIIATTRKKWHLERFGFKEVLSRGGGYFLMQLQILPNYQPAKNTKFPNTDAVIDMIVN